ncbi:carrier superfamily protein [Acanthamoeba castellanii str. Neff]|uniref:Carrier superfamily protein n=1 Tax=Acanthamoeba castellanii (strain ATCC 30010 / Neff) TaxID=1257118 RepID=L8GZ23_ACACF|nr:carrier superfamily protein [Acanthamoeba castellanii str. Neff]ELR18509.1 carrier superfamily protein [Acanthamoeba castellanii str. Neff]
MVHARAAQEAAPQPEPEPEQGSLATTFAVCQGVLFGVLARVVQYRSAVTALLSGSNAHYRGLAAALIGDARLAVQETKQLWREDGVHVCQPMVDQVLGVSEKDIEERTLRFHLRKVALVDRVLKGKDHFYASFPSSTLMGLLLYGSDALRAKVLHWHKATFFPDFMPRGDASDDEADIGSEEEEEEVFEEPSTARRVAYVASTTLAFATVCSLTAICTNPLDAVSLRMASLPHVYGPLGTLGTLSAVYRQEGVWGFYHGLLPSIISHCGLSCLGLEEEANTGHVAL